MKLLRLQFRQVLKRATLFGLCLSLGQICSSNDNQAFTYFHRHRNRYLSVPNYQLSIRQSVDDFDCSMACRRNPNCISYNIATSRGLNNLKSCELLSTTIFNSSKNLQESIHFDHWTMENPCLQSACLNGGICVPIYETEDYTCDCPDSYAGGKCEKEECSEANAVALGLGSGTIPNHRMTASSYFAAGWEPWRGRLGHRGGSNCWGAKQNRLGEYLQVDLGQLKKIVKIATQGRADANYWVKAFELRYSLDGSQWTRYKVNGVVKEFPANWDRNSIKTNLVSPSFKARYVRIYPTKYHSWMDLRAELYGC